MGSRRTPHDPSNLPLAPRSAKPSILHGTVSSPPSHALPPSTLPPPATLPCTVRRRRKRCGGSERRRGGAVGGGRPAEEVDEVWGGFGVTAAVKLLAQLHAPRLLPRGPLLHRPAAQLLASPACSSSSCARDGCREGSRWLLL
eukprot:2165914-Rhodomonas_salina.2